MGTVNQAYISGIQTVGQVKIMYRYNSVNRKLPAAAGMPEVDTSNGIQFGGIRLDDDFLNANPQLASSLIVPLLGGGGIALTNNNRSGQLTLSCVRAGTPSDAGTLNPSIKDDAGNVITTLISQIDASGNFSEDDTVCDPVGIAQQQQAQLGGDSVGADVLINFNLNGKTIAVQFDKCTVAQSGIIHLAGNNVPGYGVVWNYLNWGVKYDATPSTFYKVTANGNLAA